MYSWERHQITIVNSFNQDPMSNRVKVLFILAADYGMFVSSKRLQLHVYGTTGARAHGAVVEIIKGLRLAAERENTPHAIAKGSIYGEVYWRLHERAPKGGIHRAGGGCFSETAEGCGDNPRISGGGIRASNEKYTTECYKHRVLAGEEVGDQGEEKPRAVDHSKRGRSRALWRGLGVKNGS
jgi:hypothetical protein